MLRDTAEDIEDIRKNIPLLQLRRTRENQRGIVSRDGGGEASTIPLPGHNSPHGELIRVRWEQGWDAAVAVMTTCNLGPCEEHCSASYI